MAQVVEFRLLGPLEVRASGAVLPLGSPKRQIVLALLVVNAGRVVSLEELVDELWSSDPPASAVANARGYAATLRRLFESVDRSNERLVRQGAGYLLRAETDEVDLLAFTAAASAGREALRRSDPTMAAARFSDALACWRGPMLAGLPRGPVVAGQCAVVEEERLAVTEELAEARLASDEPAQAVRVMREHVQKNPLRERAYALLMRSLYAAGDVVGATTAYAEARETLVGQLGIEPGRDLQELHRAVLNREPSLEPRRARPHVVPAQLPSGVVQFVGRDDSLKRLDAFLSDEDSRPRAVVISAIAGTAGIGKTALAVHWAHQVRERFPDGQLYVNLRGYDPDQPMAAADALARFLTTLGVAGQDIPLEVDERAARYRTETAGRRLLIVLDNASTVEQVRPLLPGTPSCAVVVTSRDSLAGLVAVHGAHRLDLDLLPEADAITLLRRLIGRRVDAEPDAAATLAGQCVRLPLALRVAAELAATRPHTPLAKLVAELSDQQRRLDLLDAGGDPRAAVTSVFSWSLRHLPADAAHAFRLLGLHPGPDLDAYAAAALTGASLDHTHRTLDLLARAHLIHPTGPGRYGMHDLLRAYATGLATANDTQDGHRAALGRLFDYYLATAATAVNTLHPAEAHHRPYIPPPATSAPALTDLDTARSWLDTERLCLVAVAAHTAVHGWPDHTVRLSATLFRYLNAGHYTDALAVHGYARGAAQQTGDQAGEALALTGLGGVYRQFGRYEPSMEYCEQALVLFRRVGDKVGEARALGNLGILEQRLGRNGSAIHRYQQALALYRQVGDRVGEARGLNGLGFVEERLGRYRPAIHHYRQAMAVFRQVGDQSGEATALSNLGLVEALLGRHGQAIDHVRQAVTLCRKLGDRAGEAWALDDLGSVHIRLDHHEQATEYHQKALTLFRQIGDREGEVSTLNGLGEATHTCGRAADALACHTDALTIAAEIGARDQQARAHTGLGHAYHTLGDPTRARHHYHQALVLYTDLGMPDANEIRAHLTTTGGATPDDHQASPGV